MAFLSMIAAPILLLRSKESIAFGVELLRSYWKFNQREILRRDKIIIFLAATLIAGIASYWLAMYWLVDYVGWSLFWRSAVLGTFAVAVAGAVAVAVAVSGVGAISGMGVSVIGIAVAIAGVLLGVSVVGIAVAVAGVLAGVIAGIVVGVTVVSGTGTGTVALALFFPFMALGILIRGLIIRLYATMCYPLTGLVQLPQNWRETLLVIDFTHPPELLPQASTIIPALSVKKIWAARKANKGIDHLYTSTFIAICYLPALAYRWSLKASVWLWFPLSLALTPPLQNQKAQGSRRKMAILHAWHWPYFLIATVGILWLLSATPLLETWLPLLPAEYVTIHANLPAPPTLGFRYALACLGCLLIMLLIIKSRNLKASHGSILTPPPMSLIN